MPTVYTDTDDVTCDAALVQDRTICCVNTAADRASVVPIARVERIDADPDLLVTPPELPEWFFGGGRYGFVNVDRFPSLQRHLEDLSSEKY
jgi:hypothetical protein